MVQSRRSRFYSPREQMERDDPPGNCGHRRLLPPGIDHLRRRVPSVAWTPWPAVTASRRDTTGAKPLQVRLLFYLRECKPVLGLASRSMVVFCPLRDATKGAARQNDAGLWSSW